MMRSNDPFTLPVGFLGQQASPLGPADSLRVGANELRTGGHVALPVRGSDGAIRLLDEPTIARLLAEGSDPDAMLGSLNLSPAKCIGVRETGAQALRILHETGASVLVLVNLDGDPVGVISPSRLMSASDFPFRPSMVGGMATPFGIYLTGGGVRAGVAPWALACTGAAMFLMLVIAQYVGLAVASVGSGVPVDLVTVVVFLLMVRLSPIAGTHGAEHMVVNTIERGEEVKPEVVCRMDRYHPRCGTNLAIAAVLFLGVMSATWIPGAELRLLVAVVATALLWRPLGRLLQIYVTTKPPNARQIEVGVRAGRELLEKYAQYPGKRMGLMGRLAYSGVFHVMAGALTAAALVALTTHLLHLPPQWRVL